MNVFGLSSAEDSVSGAWNCTAGGCGNLTDNKVYDANGYWDGDADCGQHGEPVDDFDSTYPEYDNDAYLDGYDDGSAGAVFTITTPRSASFTLTVN